MYEKYVALRDKNHVTDYEMAKQTGVSTSTLTNWKYGRYTPRLQKLKLIADFFSVLVDYFLGGANEAAESEVVIPEIDTYRIGKLVSGANQKIETTGLAGGYD